MALLHHPALADYEAQLGQLRCSAADLCALTDDGVAALEDFLTSFKSSSASTAAAAASAFEGLNIDGDGLSDEYDFMDDAAEAGGNPAANSRRKETSYKYMEMLQKIANRDLEEIQIDLDDLDTVRHLDVICGYE